MKSVAIVDTNILVASVVARDPANRRALDVLRDRRHDLVIPALCVAETCYFIAMREGPQVEARFLHGLSRFEVIAPEGEDWPRIAELVRQYADWPLGGTDASIVALAERLNTDTIATLDRRHFERVRPRHCNQFRLLPS